MEKVSCILGSSWTFFKQAPLTVLGLFSFGSCISCAWANLVYLTECVKVDLDFFFFFNLTSLSSAVVEAQACASVPGDVVLGDC